MNTYIYEKSNIKYGLANCSSSFLQPLVFSRLCNVFTRAA